MCAFSDNVNVHLFSRHLYSLSNLKIVLNVAGCVFRLEWK